MTDHPPLPTSSDAVAIDVLPCIDRRSSPRVDCHTVVTAVAPRDAVGCREQQVIRAHSQDVSVGGAKLISQEQLPSKRLFLRFLLPTFGDRYVEAEVVNESLGERHTMTGQVTQHYIYGVRFTGVMLDDITINPATP